MSRTGLREDNPITDPRLTEPRILVIAYRDAHHAWNESLGPLADYCVVGQPRYGARYDLIIIDLPTDELHKTRTQDWLFQDIRCRLSPRGKWVYVQ